VKAAVVAGAVFVVKAAEEAVAVVKAAVVAVVRAVAAAEAGVSPIYSSKIRVIVSTSFGTTTG
jgi:hypothetical protein